MKPIKGTTEQCIAHLAGTIEGRDSTEKRKMVANFACVSDDSVQQWFKGSGRLPVGEQLVRTRFYLEFHGYIVSELEALDAQIRNAARVFAFSVVTLLEIGELLGYTGEHTPGELLRIFRGARKVSARKLEEFRSLAELYGDRLEEKKRTTPKIFQAEVPVQHVQVAFVHEPTQPALRTIGESNATLIAALAGMVKAILPLTEHALSNSFTAEERQRVRDLADGKNISRLSNLFTQLSGEAARTALAGKQQ